jgi:hypothetical protein
VNAPDVQQPVATSAFVFPASSAVGLYYLDIREDSLSLMSGLRAQRLSLSKCFDNEWIL